MSHFHINLWLEQMNRPAAEIIISLAILLFAGFLMTRLTKKLHLPNVTGYILAGILIGPYVLNLIPTRVLAGMDFVTDIALAYIAFGVGKYFKLSRLKKNGKRVVIITLFEALAAAAAVALAMRFIFRLPVAFSLLLGAIASATAPASTIMTIRQYRAKGEFVNTILQVVALDDAVALAAFSVCAAAARTLENNGELRMMVVIGPLLLNLLMVAAGGVCGLLLQWIISGRRSQEHRLVLINAVILGISGICSLMDISPLLSCMMMGAVYVNRRKDKTLFKEVNHFSPPVMLLFFVLSGMRLNLPVLAAAGLIGVGYFFVRIAGKYAGAWAGAKISGAPAPVRRWLGLALIPQAGVSIGLAALGQRMLPAESGALLSTIILSSGVLYEMAGPACAKLSLILSGSIKRKAVSGKKPDTAPKLVFRKRPVPAAPGETIHEGTGQIPSLPSGKKFSSEKKSKKKGKFKMKKKEKLKVS